MSAEEGGKTLTIGESWGTGAIRKLRQKEFKTTTLEIYHSDNLYSTTSD